VQSDQSERVGNPAEILGGLIAVWMIGTLLTALTASLATSGRLWQLGLPRWLIFFTVLVGIWQWVYLWPAVKYARRKERRGLYNGMLWGGVLFSLTNVIGWVVILVLFRHVSLQ
jgi:hypothetical protein